MAYQSEIYRLAEEEFRLRREAARREQEERQNAVYEACPRIVQIGKELSATAMSVVQAVRSGSGGDAAARVEAIKAKNRALLAERAALLEGMGLSADYLDLHFACPACEDRGADDQGRICECYKNTLSRIAFEQSRLGRALAHQSFESFSLSYYSDEPEEGQSVSPRRQMRQILQFCKKYAADFAQQTGGLLFTGCTGLGKTHLSTSVAREVLAQGFSVIYETAPALFARMEDERFGRAPKGTSDQLLDCDLLILDDLGSEFTTPFVVSALFSLINGRTIAGKKTIISTNFTLTELSQHYNDKIMSRILGDFTSFRFVGSDIRQQKRQAGR